MWVWGNVIIVAGSNTQNFNNDSFKVLLMENVCEGEKVNVYAIFICSLSVWRGNGDVIYCESIMAFTSSL